MSLDLVAHLARQSVQEGDVAGREDVIDSAGHISAAQIVGTQTVGAECQPGHDGGQDLAAHEDEVLAGIAIGLDAHIVRGKCGALGCDLRTGADRRKIPQIGAQRREDSLGPGRFDVVDDLRVVRRESRQRRESDSRIEQSDLRRQNFVATEFHRDEGWLQSAHCSDLCHSGR